MERSDNVEIEKIALRIRESLHKNDTVNFKLAELPFSSEESPIPFDKGQSPFRDDIHKDIISINANWNLSDRSYHIESHRQIFGPVLIKGRKLVHGEVRRYVDPIMFKQIDFNSSTVRILNHTITKINEIAAKINLLEEILSNTKKELFDEIANPMSHFRNAIRERNEEEIAESIERITEAAQSKTNPASQLDGINFFHFAERFRGSREVVMQMQSTFIRFFKECDNVLDIGCGRGEFLELLRDNSIKARGIDIDKDMVDYCKSKGFVVEMADGLTYLETIEDNSIDGIFLDQVAEHLEPNYLIRMLAAYYKKMKYGHNILIGTVNPLSFGSLANFYIDPSHKKLMHPLTLEFLLESAHFLDIKIEFFAQIPSEAKLKQVDIRNDMDEKGKNFISIYNKNIEMLNETIYGPQGYMVIGKKVEKGENFQ